MKRTVCILVLILCMGGIVVFANEENGAADILQRMGLDLRGSVQQAAGQLQTEDGTTVPLFSESESAGTVLGEEVPTALVEIKAVMYAYGGSETPLKDAWEATKQEVFERRFAMEKGIYPTEQEIDAFTREMREAVESSQAGIDFQNTLLDAVGMDVDEYWNVYKPQIESPVHLTKIKIAQYCEEHDLDWQEILEQSDISGEITNRSLLEKYE